jgi:manganese-dependent inorganic pyrophosphatase
MKQQKDTIKRKPYPILRRRKMPNQIVTSYKNPDLDGVASSITLSAYLKETKGLSAKPLIFGNLDSETSFVLDLLGLPHPQSVSKCAPTDVVYLVDTHHLKQIDGNVPPESVVQIYDHHPAGDAEAFPNAEIVNEKVGAVATLLAEKFRDENVSLDANLSVLLYAAIVSNTLDFTAPPTTERDHYAADWLSNQAAVPPNLVDQMFQARSNFDALTTQELLSGDYKEFDFSGVKVGISQIEGMGITELLTRPDFEIEIRQLRSHVGADHVFLSAVDIREQKTYLVTDREETQVILSEAVDAEFSAPVAVFDRILLRKSDLIPSLETYLEK